MKIKDPYNLYSKLKRLKTHGFVGVKHMSNYKKTYTNEKLSNKINGKKVRFWILVGLGSDQDDDIFIPVF